MELEARSSNSLQAGAKAEVWPSVHALQNDKLMVNLQQWEFCKRYVVKACSEC